MTKIIVNNYKEVVEICKTCTSHTVDENPGIKIRCQTCGGCGITSMSICPLLKWELIETEAR